MRRSTKFLLGATAGTFAGLFLPTPLNLFVAVFGPFMIVALLIIWVFLWLNRYSGPSGPSDGNGASLTDRDGGSDEG